MEKDLLLLSVFVAVESAHAFSAFMPSYFTIKKFASAEDRERLRSGYPPAILFALILGASVAGITKKTAPFWIALVIIVFMIGCYEVAITKGEKEK